MTLPLPLEAFEDAYARVGPHIHHTPLLTSRMLSERTGFDVRLKAEIFQRTGSYKIRGPLNKFTHLTDEERARGVVCSSAGNHAQGVALAARLHGIHAVVVMAENATPSKIAATRGYGAEVVLHGTIWDEANEKARELVRDARPDLRPSVRRSAADRGTGHARPRDRARLGRRRRGGRADWRRRVDLGRVDGGQGAEAVDSRDRRRVVRRARHARQRRDGHVVTLDRVDCIIDGLRVKRVGETTFEVVRRFVDEIVTLPDEQIFDAMIWIMAHAKLVVEGAAAAPVAALLHGARQRAARRQGRLRPERRQRQPRSDSRPALELTPGADRPRIGISACLLGDEVRFDGGHKRDPFLTVTLSPHVECVQVCPEVEIGTGHAARNAAAGPRRRRRCADDHHPDRRRSHRRDEHVVAPPAARTSKASSSPATS